MEQRTDEWIAARLGKVTASRLYDALGRQRSGNYYATRGNYLMELVCERLTGERAPRFVNGTMQWGIDNEPDARDACAFALNRRIQPVGFVDHPTIPMTGASPDGLIDDDGLFEVKCPLTATHVKLLMGEPIEDRYVMQVQWQLACTGRQWAKFASFDPRLPPGMQLKIIDVPRDYRMIAELEDEVQAFLAEINVTINELRSRYQEAA